MCIEEGTGEHFTVCVVLFRGRGTAEPFTVCFSGGGTAERLTVLLGLGGYY